MADEARQRHRQLFERFCRQKFHDGGRGCSKTISTKKRDKVIKFLINRDQQDVSAHFRFWVKNRGFQMVQMDGQSVLCLPNKQRVPSDPTSVEWKKVAAVEEFFDLISAYHCTEDGSHLGIKKTLAKIALVYECLTRTAVEGYMEFCTVCRSRSRRSEWKDLAPSSALTWDTHHTPLAFMTSGQIDLIDMNPHRDGQFQWVGHFTDQWSCFHVLFPLASVSAEEVAQNLCRHVLAVFGVPQTLFCNLGRQFTTQVVRAIAQQWEGEVDMDVATQRVHNPVIDQATSKLEELIAEHIHHKPMWTKWLPYVQYSLNTVFTAKKIKPGLSQTPFDILFRTGFSRGRVGEGDGEEGEGEGEEREGEGGFSEGDEDGEMEEEGEQLQLEVVSDSITQTADSPVWQMNVLPASTSNTNSATPLTAVSASQAAIATATDPHNRGAGVGGKEGGGEAMTVQQILMPPDTDFLSSFYEAAELSNMAEGNSRKRKRKQTPVRVTPAATPTKNPITSATT